MNTNHTKQSSIPTCSASNAHKGKTAADTNKRKKYEAILCFKQLSRAKVIIEAASLAEPE